MLSCASPSTAAALTYRLTLGLALKRNVQLWSRAATWELRAVAHGVGGWATPWHLPRGVFISSGCTDSNHGRREHNAREARKSSVNPRKEFGLGDSWGCSVTFALIAGPKAMHGTGWAAAVTAADGKIPCDSVAGGRNAWPCRSSSACKSRAAFPRSESLAQSLAEFCWWGESCSVLPGTLKHGGGRKRSVSEGGAKGPTSSLPSVLHYVDLLRFVVLFF